MSTMVNKRFWRQVQKGLDFTKIDRFFATSWSQAKRIATQHTSQLMLALGMIGIVAHITIPAAGQSAFFTQPLTDPATVGLMVDAMKNKTESYGTLPISFFDEPDYTITVPITAYSSEPWQTDDTPFITAIGTHVRDGIVAANFLPIGTRIRIPELYGNKVFIVEDRMNARYWEHVDIWMAETPDARNFGKVVTQIEVFPRIPDHARLMRKQERQGAVATHLWSTSY